MKNLLNKINQFVSDNQEVICKILFIGLALALFTALVLAMTISGSAADDPIEAEQAVIPAGTYSFKLDLEPLLVDDAYPQEFIDMRYTVSSVVVDGVSVSTNNIFDGFYVGWDEEGDSIFQLYGYYFDNFSEFSVSVGSTSITVLGIVCRVSNGLWYGAVGGNDGESIAAFPSFGRTITILENASVPSYFAEWFLDNTNAGGSVDPDPDPDPDNPTYTINAGWYLWNDVLLGEFIPHTLSFNYRTYQRIEESGIAYYSYWSSMIFDNSGDSNSSRLYYSSISNGRVLVYDNNNGGWLNETYKRFYIPEALTLSSEDYFVFAGYTEYYGDTPPTFPDEPIPSVPDPDNNIFTNIIGGVLDAVDSFTIFGGFSLLDLISTLLGGMALVWILKLLAGG